MRRVPFFVDGWSRLTGFCVVVTLVVSGCAAANRPHYTVAEAGRAQILGFENIRAHADDPRPVKSVHDPWRPVIGMNKPTMLAISGGGAGGAFSVGVLSAWSERADRPTFDVVTGVSTGALIAPFAFLGPGYDQQLRSLYLSDQASSLVDIDWRGLGVFSPSLLRGDALSHMVEENITGAVLSRIAHEHQAGRRLLVMTTNLDTQRAVVWNVGAIASSGRADALPLVHQILTASASVPGILPPVSIKTVVDGKLIEELHSDGGSSAQFFTLPEQLIVAPGRSRNEDLHIYVIINNALIPEFSMSPRKALPIMARAYATLLKSQTKLGLIAIFNFAQRSDIDLDIASIEEQVPYSMTDPLNETYMRRVYGIGYQKARDGRLWVKYPKFTVSP
ncbi:putative acylesterase/phospholipase RssA [Neorhizobium sp. 2083]|uniref:patatin-like phospholipase family protein n=1 Tax=Neorhizobium sp. 2083 TaxID=2817762 RepID=UPI00285FF3EB|nr:patatin-like phospholipase family protein [Neorhizobium sp. 2083]MDR6820780.1 putative acylesterase/phospholipase RssA [Neorhizobium sp. 2083]